MKATMIALLGNPNAGKTTLFNALTGLRQRVGNYPGVTVERKIGELSIAGHPIELVDLPGTYSLAAQSPDEMLAVDLLLGQHAGGAPIDGIVAIVDASNLQRNLYFLSQLLELGRPTIVVLNMMDVAERKGITIDCAALEQQLGVPVVPAQANAGIGLEAVRTLLAGVACSPPPQPASLPQFPEAFRRALDCLHEELAALTPSLGRQIPRVEAQRILIDTDGYAAARLIKQAPTFGVRLTALRGMAQTNGSLASVEAATRYQWIRRVMQQAVRLPARPRPLWTERADRLFTHKIWGSAILVVVTALVFQSIYAWSAPLMDPLDWCFGTVGAAIAAVLPAGALQSLVVDGLVKGDGSELGRRHQRDFRL